MNTFTFMRKIAILFLGLLVVSANLVAQHNQKSSSQILRDIKKLNVLGNVLYWAAHPDDENTRLIAYFSNELLLNTGYLAATRGDGGQNLIGPELTVGLGVIRTQELLAARSVDGGQQFLHAPMILAIRKQRMKPLTSGIKTKYWLIWFGRFESLGLM